MNTLIPRVTATHEPFMTTTDCTFVPFNDAKIEEQLKFLMGEMTIEELARKSGVSERQIKIILKGSWLKASHKSFKKLGRFFKLQVIPASLEEIKKEL